MGIEFLISLIYLASAGVLFLTAGLILKENVKSFNNRVAAAMLFTAGVAPCSVALYKTFLIDVQASPSLINLFYVWELFFPFLLLFSMVFPSPGAFFRKHKRIIQFAFVPHIFHVILVIFFNDPDRLFGLLDFDTSLPLIGQVLSVLETILKILAALLGFLLVFHVKFFSLINLTYVVAAVYFLSLGYRAIDNRALKIQVRVVILGITAAMGLYVISIIIPTILSLRFPSGLREIMILLALTVGPGSIAWAVIRYKFMDIGLLARQSLVYTISTAIVVGGYLLVISELSSMFAEAFAVQSRLLDIIVVVILLLFFQPLYNQVDDFVRRIFIKSRSDYRRLMEEFSRQLVAIFDIEQLATAVNENMNKEMFIEQTHIILKAPGQPFYRFVGEAVEYSLEERLAASLIQRRRPVFIADLRSALEKGKLGNRLLEKDCQLLVPLIDRDELVGIMALSAKIAGFRYTYEDFSLLLVVANQIVVALNNARLYAESLEKQRLEEELELARKIQLNLLPSRLPEHHRYEFAAFNYPSRHVGGDYYDFMPLGDGRLGIVIADVSGKGVPAALLMARVQAIMQTQKRQGLPIENMLAQLNDFLVSSSSPDRFVTMFYGELDLETGLFQFCNAGHNYPFVVSPNGETRFLVEGGLILGAFPNLNFVSAQIKISSNDVVVMYTDGLSEAMNLTEEEFGERRLVETVTRVRNESAQLICGTLIKNVRRHAAGAEEADDMTLVVLKAR